MIYLQITRSHYDSRKAVGFIMYLSTTNFHYRNYAVIGKLNISKYVINFIISWIILTRHASVVLMMQTTFCEIDVEKKNFLPNRDSDEKSCWDRTIFKFDHAILGHSHLFLSFFLSYYVVQMMVVLRIHTIRIIMIIDKVMTHSDQRILCNSMNESSSIYALIAKSCNDFQRLSFNS